MEEIHNIIGNKTVFIRFNPDNYIYIDSDGNNNIVNSPWIYYKKELKISSDKKISKEWNNRLETLKNTIQKYIMEEPTEQFTEVRLYYNQKELFSGVNAKENSVDNDNNDNNDIE